MPELKKRILVVDDEPDVLKVLKIRLEKAGYEIVTAMNGQEGLKAVMDFAPDMVVTDVLMPVMDGFTFYKKLKESPSTKNIPILVLTARGHMEDSFRVVGADEFLTKPFDHEQLLAKVQGLFSREVIKQSVDKKILVAGADAKVLEIMTFQLKKVGCTVDAAKDGPEIITKVVQFKPDILIMEVPLYGMAADEVIKILRQMAQFANRPILIYNFYRTEDLGSTTIHQKALLIDDAKDAAMQAGASVNIGRFNEFSFLDTAVKFLSGGNP